MSTSLVSEIVTFAAASGKKKTAIVVTYKDQLLRAGVQYDLPHGSRKEHLRSILGEKFIVFSALCFCFSCCLLLL